MFNSGILRNLIIAGFVLSFLAGTRPGHAEGALAIGIVEGDPNKGLRHSMYVNEPNAEAATSSAMKDCRNARNPKTGQACKLIQSFHDQCAAVAVNGDAAATNDPVIAVGWAIEADSATAISRAKAQCDTMRKGRGKPCEIDNGSKSMFCDGKAK